MKTLARSGSRTTKFSRNPFFIGARVKTVHIREVGRMTSREERLQGRAWLVKRNKAAAGPCCTGKLAVAGDSTKPNSLSPN